MPPISTAWATASTSHRLADRGAHHGRAWSMAGAQTLPANARGDSQDGGDGLERRATRSSAKSATNERSAALSLRDGASASPISGSPRSSRARRSGRYPREPRAARQRRCLSRPRPPLGLPGSGALATDERDREAQRRIRCHAPLRHSTPASRDPIWPGFPSGARGTRARPGSSPSPSGGSIGGCSKRDNDVI